jgi:hypothetical protein
MKVVQFTSNTNRRTLGSMNDFVYHVTGVLESDPSYSLEDIAYHLSKVPCAPLHYGYPREAALDLIDPPAHNKERGESNQ